MPGADFADRLPTESKPWFSSLAADSHQAGVSNDPGDAQDAAFPTGRSDEADDEPRGRDPEDPAED